MSKYLVSSGVVEECDIDQECHYAELWLGTHSKTPNTTQDGQTLSQYVMENPQLLGQEIVQKFGATLPFLLKVLSIGHPLQLQIHPTKDEARELHRKNPRAFLDDNHKPEMAVALTPFTALCGFRDPAEILEISEVIEDFADTLGDETLNLLKKENVKDSEKIKACYNSIFQSDKKADYLDIQKKIKSKVESLQIKISGGQEFLTIFDSFEGDPGCFAPFLLNIYKLEPGEAIFVPAGEIHAYISGDCIEVREGIIY